MVAAVAVLLLQVAIPSAASGYVDLPKKTDSQVVHVESSSAALPAAPTPRLANGADSARPSSVAGDSNDTTPLAGINVPQPAPVLAGFRAGPSEVVRTNRPWIALTVAQHGAATFDAWSTRRAINAGRIETDPLLKPFANSNSLYAAMQVGPTLFDFIGHRMYRSQNSVIRKLWWVPQIASTAGFVYAGTYNTMRTH